MPTDVMLVDDEPQILTILRESLIGAGFRVSTEQSGKDALVSLGRRPPDLMVVDLRMPKMSGLELMQKAREVLPDTPMIVLTGYSDTKSAVEALRLGAYDYLTKPVIWTG